MLWRRAAFLAFTGLLAGCAAEKPVPDDGLRFKTLDFSQLEGWSGPAEARVSG